MSTLITKLPEEADQIVNLTCINDISQKFYQIYKANAKPTITKELRYDIITAHGRIGHAPKYLLLLSNASIGTAAEIVIQTEKNKIKKGYEKQPLNKNPISLLKTAPKVKSKVTNKKTGKPILHLVTADMIKPVKEPEKKKQPTFNRLIFLGQ
jgi:hypothetical protein